MKGINKNLLDGYADLIVKCGLNISDGQEVVIKTAPVQMDFIRTVVEKCYLSGASKVDVEFYDDACRKMDYIHQTEEKLSSIYGWEIEKVKFRSETLPATLWLDSDDPDGMNGIDNGKRMRAQQAVFPKIKKYRDAMENRHQWCIAGIPSAEWSMKVFPGLSPKQAETRLWKAILKASRADSGNAIDNWRVHNETTHSRAAWLNSLHLSELRYHSSNGTDFTVGLMKKGRFCGGSEKDLSGRVFNPNIPSEEIFTTPMKGMAEGIVHSTKPLSYNGVLINDFSVSFKNGMVSSVHAEEGQDALEKIVSMDEGAAYLGECALVGWNSPINNTGILFYNTLYDENACCHLALGRGFNDCVSGFETMSDDEIKSAGVNDSMIHVDFMIGTDDLSIDGIDDAGKSISIFRNGDWSV